MKPRHPRLIEAIRLSAAGRNAEAVPMIRQLAAAGEPDALFLLAEMNWRGGIVPLNPPNARILFYAAGDKGSAEGGVIYTNLLASGIAGPRDWRQALARLEVEAARDLKRAMTLAVVRTMELTEDGDPIAVPEPERLSDSPDVQLFRGLFTAAECEYLAIIADPLLGPLKTTESDRTVDPVIIADGAALHWQIEDPAIHALNRRLAAASGTEAVNGEAMQILRYGAGQYSRPHQDYLDFPENERAKTAFVWLNHGYDGGETRFIRAELNVHPGQGDALLLGNLLPDGKPDPMAEYADLPVTAGEKHLAVRWIHATRWAL